MPSMKDCATYHSSKIFVVKERRSEVRFNNPEQYDIEMVQVDGCLIIDGLKCDKLINVIDRDVSVFVELKGADVKHALDQLTRSHDVLLGDVYKNVTWIISSTRCPLASTEIALLVRQLRSKKNVTLKIKNTPVTHDV